MYITGVVELIGAIGMIVGVWVIEIAFLAGIWLCGTMFGAIFTHIIRVKDNEWLPSFVLFILALAVAILRGAEFYTQVF